MSSPQTAQELRGKILGVLMKEARLKARKTETPEGLQLRLATAREEYKRLDLFDYVVVNGDGELDQTVDTIRAIIQAEHHRTHPRRVSL